MPRALTGSDGSAPLFTTTTLSLSLLTLSLHRGLLVETTTLQLLVDALMCDFAFESFDGAFHVIAIHNDLKGSKNEFILTQKDHLSTWITSMPSLRIEKFAAA